MSLFNWLVHLDDILKYLERVLWIGVIGDSGVGDLEIVFSEFYHDDGRVQTSIKHPDILVVVEK